MDELKPCPFCGAHDVAVVEGDTFRRRLVQCNGCGAQGPDVRIQTAGSGTDDEWEQRAKVGATTEWNRRAMLSAAPDPVADQLPVARVTGYFDGHCVVAPLNTAALLPVGMALFANAAQQAAEIERERTARKTAQESLEQYKGECTHLQHKIDRLKGEGAVDRSERV